MRHDPQWRWAIRWSVILLVLSCVPYIIAIFIAPEGWQFAGILVNPYDGHSYLAKMRQGFDGNWLFHLSFTPEPHEGTYIFLFYLLLGHLARLTHAPLIIIFHLARLLAGLALLLAAFRFIRQITPQPHEQRLAFTLLLTSAGLGWLGILFNAFPIDLWVPEAFVPYSIYANPHFSLGMALMVLVIQTVVWPEKNRVFTSFLAGLAALVLALVLPFALLTVWAILAVYTGWLTWHRRRIPWPPIGLALITFISAGPVIFYDYWVAQNNPVLAGWSAQNITPAPAILDMMLGFGLVGILAVLGAWLIARNRQYIPGEWVVLLWAVTTLALVYFPFFNLQRRLINGLHIPLCILAAIGLIRWLNHRSIKVRHRQQLIKAVIIVGLLGTIFVWTIPLIGLLQSPTKSETSALFYIRVQEKEIFNFLNKTADQNDIVLAAPRLGLFVPGQTGARVYYGHPFETINAQHKKNLGEAFYRGEAVTFTPPPTYIIYGPAERALGQPANLEKYTVIYTAGDTVVYRPN